MSSFIETFGGYTLGETVVFFMAIGFVIGLATYAFKFAIKLNKMFESREDKLDEISEMLKKHDEIILKMQDNMDNYYELSKCVASDRLNQRIKYYHSINGIPSEEFEELRYFGDVVKKCKINHGIGDRVDLCIERLPILYNTNSNQATNQKAKID